MGNDHQPLPITHYLLPIAHYLLPIAHYLLPIAHYSLPIIHDVPQRFIIYFFPSGDIAPAFAIDADSLTHYVT